MNPGEGVIVVPEADQNVEQGPVEVDPEVFSPDSVLNQPNIVQWKEYFFGQTLSVQPQPTPPDEATGDPEAVEG